VLVRAWQPVRPHKACPIYTLRLGRLREQLSPPGTDPRVADRLLMKLLVERGLRAQARTANLLTGQLYVSLDFASKAEPVRFDSQAAVPSLPTTLGTLAELQPQLMDVLSRISKIRFDEIGNDVQQSLAALKSSGAALETTLTSANTLIKTLTPTAQQALVDVQKTLASAQQTLRAADASLLDPQAALQRSTTQTLAELQRTAQALRVLADYLQRHPESLLRGKPADAVEGPK
jgi:paraquat-inducible protein B